MKDTYTEPPSSACAVLSPFQSHTSKSLKEQLVNSENASADWVATTWALLQSGIG